MFLIFQDRMISLFQTDNKNELCITILKLENEDLKKEVEELSEITYKDYDFTLGKITIKNLYNNGAYFIRPSKPVSNNLPVINNYGLIGIYNNYYLKTTNLLNVSIRINNNNGILDKGVIHIKHDTYSINDPVYTSGLTSIPPNILVGYVSKIIESSNGIEDTLELKFIPNDTEYVGILNV